MFARDSFPIARAGSDDDMLAGMAHAMGCGTLVEDIRHHVPVFAAPRRRAAARPPEAAAALQ